MRTRKSVIGTFWSISSSLETVAENSQLVLVEAFADPSFVYLNL